jgi:hypothetical protein
MTPLTLPEQELPMPTLTPVIDLAHGDLLYLNRRAVRVRSISFLHPDGVDRHYPASATSPVLLTAGGRTLRLAPSATVPVIRHSGRPPIVNNFEDCPGCGRAICHEGTCS